MIDIRALRRSRGLTLTDLALLSGIPTRTLAELEHGLRKLDSTYRQNLACILNVPARELGAAIPSAIPPWRTGRQPIIAALLVLCLGLLVLGAPLLRPPATTVQAQHSAGPPTSAPGVRNAALAAARPTARPSATPAPTATIAPTATPPPRFTLAADGPHGCPLAPAAGKVVLTQGYAEGTHAPADVWGAVDLGVDADSDGNAEPGSTQGQPIAATLGGVARVYPGSWPGGNYVRVENAQAGWNTAYAHLDTIAVTDGQTIATGATLGTVGSTGMASGPHLHYEVWHSGQNIDPTALLGC